MENRKKQRFWAQLPVKATSFIAVFLSGFLVAQLHSPFSRENEDPWERAYDQLTAGHNDLAMGTYYRLYKRGEPRAALFAAQILGEFGSMGSMWGSGYELEAEDKLILELLRYALGQNVEHSPAKAKDFYLRAAQQGHGNAAFILAAQDLPGIISPTTIQSAHLQVVTLAKDGSVPAQSLLCQLAINPFGVVPRYFEYCISASQEGDAEALFRLGYAYELSCEDNWFDHTDYYKEHFDITQDLSRARASFNSAAERGHTLAAERLTSFQSRHHRDCELQDRVSSALFGFAVKNLSVIALTPTPLPLPGLVENRMALRGGKVPPRK